ncbi:hypothetical protein NIES267_42590 [Calothrix parasitica NIES-267]|uniref:Uncharacterized protein n=1 Tax=Calothrix parasitica NIES-267 TaxID=1973488 RepID=A0A1Z4LU42_9CYAN|nr:hypothetical protein NIES267_42590 [Calothrix parasitica NIES-267]
MTNQTPPYEVMVGSPGSLSTKQWYKEDTYYQILVVEPSEKETQAENISRTILARKRGSGDKENLQLESFDDFKLDEYTTNNLKSYPRNGEDDKLSSYLPSSGVVLTDGFMEQLSSQLEYDKNQQTELGNFYVTIRTLLHSRKISQLIAKTWWTYLQAQENEGKLWDKFTKGKWDEIDSYILDGLIAREIFLYGGANTLNHIENESIYLPLISKGETKQEARFMILPTSRAWRGISLSLLLAGQAYYFREGKYHQISQPILSTGEITSKYSLEVDWNTFTGDIKEFISHEKPWIAYQAVLPYPPIPTEAVAENLKEWAKAEDDEKPFPFYIKSQETNEYLVDVDYFRSPYPYIPLSCS